MVQPDLPARQALKELLVQQDQPELQEVSALPDLPVAVVRLVLQDLVDPPVVREQPEAQERVVQPEVQEQLER